MIDLPCSRPVLAALVLTGSGLAVPAAHAELPDNYRTLLVAADETQSDAEFVATARLIAGVVPGGMADVLTTLAEVAPARIALQSLLAETAGAQTPWARAWARQRCVYA